MSGGQAAAPAAIGSGVALGAGIAIGAFTGGWWIVLAAALVVGGIGLAAWGMRRGQVVTAVVAALMMWVVIFAPPQSFWAWQVAGADSAVLAENASTEQGLQHWYDEIIKQIRADGEELLDSLLSIDVYDNHATAEVYLGGDRMRSYDAYEAWEREPEDGTTTARTRDTFSVDDLADFSIPDVTRAAAAMIPDDGHWLQRVVFERGDPILGDESPLLAEILFQGDRPITVQATPDGTLAPWWPSDDLPAALEQYRAQLAARGIGADEPILEDVYLTQYVNLFDYQRGDTLYSAHFGPGEFAEPDDERSSSLRSGFSLDDIDPAVLVESRDDALSRFPGVDEFDRGAATVRIRAWGPDGGDRRDEATIVIDYSSDGGGVARYDLDGDYLGDE